MESEFRSDLVITVRSEENGLSIQAMGQPKVESLVIRDYILPHPRGRADHVFV
ncbi:MAG TPA: hypothetical protein VJ023_04115 [Pyrinomonadaceae bacterium]|nr:hypothetical protein [Pyrinomonadaceae bacterium]